MTEIWMDENKQPYDDSDAVEKARELAFNQFMRWLKKNPTKDMRDYMLTFK